MGAIGVREWPRGDCAKRANVQSRMSRVALMLAAQVFRVQQRPNTHEWNHQSLSSSLSVNAYENEWERSRSDGRPQRLTLASACMQQQFSSGGRCERPTPKAEGRRVLQGNEGNECALVCSPTWCDVLPVLDRLRGMAARTRPLLAMLQHRLYRAVQGIQILLLLIITIQNSDM